MRRTRHENRAQEAPDTRRTQISRGISLNTNGKPDTRRTQISRGVSLNINRKSQQPGIIDELIESARLKEQRLHCLLHQPYPDGYIMLIISYMYRGNFELMGVQKVHLTRQRRISMYLSHRVCPHNIQNNVFLNALIA